MDNILYLTAASSQWGLGHLRRSWEIIQLLKQKVHGLKSLALVPGQEDREDLEKFLVGFDSVLSSLVEIVKYPVDCLVIDLPTAIQGDFYHLASALRCRVVAIDWYYKEEKYINEKINLRGGIAGLKFAIIRREILAKIECASRDENRHDLVVLLGAKDQKGYLPKILKLLREDKRYAGKKITFILGPMDEVERRFSESKDDRIFFYKDPVNLAQIMANAKVGLSNAGTALMEFSALGIPTMVFPQSQEEESFALTFLDEGCSVRGSLNPEDFFKQLEELWMDPKIWSRRSVKARDLVDGRGAQRVAEFIGRYISDHKAVLRKGKQ